MQDGQVTIPIEVQEATTFRNQAAALSEELRPIMSANDSAATEQLADKLGADEGADDRRRHARSDLQTLGNDALAHAKQALKIDANLTDVTASFTIIDSMLKDLKTAVAGGRLRRRRAQAAGSLRHPRLRHRAAAARLRARMAAQVESLFWQGTGDQPGLSVLLADHASVGEVQAGLDGAQSGAGGQPERAQRRQERAGRGHRQRRRDRLPRRVGSRADSGVAAGGDAHRRSRKYRRSLVWGAGLALVGAVITWVVFSSILAALHQPGRAAGSGRLADRHCACCC